MASKMAGVPARALATRTTHTCPSLSRGSRCIHLHPTRTLHAKPAKPAKKHNPHKDVWPDAVNSPPPRAATRHGPLPYNAATGPKFGPEAKDLRYEDGSQHAAWRRDNDATKQRGYQANRQRVDALFGGRAVPLIGASLAAGVLGFLTMPLLFEWLMGRCNDGACLDTHVDPAAVPSGLPPMGAAAFDTSLDVPERMMGITNLRRRLAAAATGDVLEVAVGTGRNISYYPFNPYVFEPDQARNTAMAPDLGDARPLNSFTGVDLSADALGIARRRLRVSIPAVRREAKTLGRAGAELFAAPIPESASDGDGDSDGPVFSMVGDRVRLFRGDAMHPLPPAVDLPPAPLGKGTLPPPETYTGRYDTVVQTFGLCSVADPVVLLAHMAQAVKPDTGRIILLEHGRGRWGVVNNLLDRYAGRHFTRFGCWWNRDLQAVVAQAQAQVPGLELVRIEQPGLFQFGTLHWIELRVKSQAS